MRTRLLDLVKGLLATAALLALLVGIPAALVAAVGWPLPSALPSLDAVVGAVRYGQVADTTLIKLLAVIVWVAWAQLTVSVAVEAAAVVRGRPARRVPGAGAMQFAAARLVPTALLLVSALGPRPALASVTATSATAWSASAPSTADAQLISAPLGALVAAPGQDLRAAEAAPAATQAAPLYEVQRGDTLWELAERTLGDGYRWTEIRDLNVGRPQPDGGALALGSELIRRGWQLALPGDPDTSATAAAATEVTVQPGDSLSTIAERVYGSPDAYPALYDANRDIPQDDGGALIDADLIHPGWRLNLPSTPEAAPSPPVHVAEPAEPDVAELPAPAPAPAPDVDPLPHPGPEETPDAPAVEELDGAPVDEQPAAPAPTRTATAPAPRSDPSDIPATIAAPAADDDVDSGSGLVAPAVAGASALVAGSLLWTLARLRGRQARRRRPGRDLPLPGPELAAVEHTLRAAAADQPVEWLDATLRLLTVRLRERSSPTETAPRLLVLRVGEFGVELLLDTPDDQPPAGFELADAGYVWRLDPSLALADVQKAAGDAAPIAPALATLGETPEGPALVNLEHLGLLRVEGPDEVVQAFLSGLTVELSTAPWAAAVTVYPIVDADDPLAQLPGVQPGTLAELAPRLQALAQANRTAIGDHDTTLSARAADDGEDWPPVVVVIRDAAAHLADQLAELLAAAQSPGSGLAVVAAGDIHDATWRLQLNDDATATLEPLGLSFTPAGMDDYATAAAAGLLELATADDIARPTPLPDRESSPPPAVAVDPLAVEVVVLGPVSVTGWETDEVRPTTVEIVAYLAAASGPVTTDKLRTALWPDGVKLNTFKTNLSRTRRALGVDSTGAFHLPEAKDSRYRLGPEVGCDWTRFQALMAAARTAAPPHAAQLLRQALELVQGSPFEAPAGGAYQWAYDEQLVSVIEVAVIDAAYRLAELALEADDPDLAVWATRQGHLVTPDHEGLYRARMRAHAALGDLDAVHQAFREAQRAAQAFDALEDVQTETQQLYQQLYGRGRRAARGA